MYLYGIKIQTNSKQNSTKKFAENHRFFEDFFFFAMLAGSSKPNRVSGRS
jgi:hypothetical protein